MTEPERGQFGKQAYWDFVKGLKSIQQLEVLLGLGLGTAPRPRHLCPGRYRHFHVIGLGAER